MPAISAQEQDKVLILDGGLGTSLEDNHGVRFDESTPLWSSHLLVADQGTLLACQRDFGRVPVDIILTATYQVSVEGFQRTRTDRFPEGIEGREIPPFVQDAIRIAREAGEAHGAKVALSLGPYGACMIPSQEYSGKYDEDHSSLQSLQSWHLDRLNIFREAGAFSPPVSYIAVETIPRVDEIIAIRKALDESGALVNGMPFWISCLYPTEQESLPDGTSVREAVTAMLSPAFARARPWGLGINCTKIWRLERLIAHYEAAWLDIARSEIAPRQPALVLYPDGTNGEVYNTATQTWELPKDAAAPELRLSWEDQLTQIVRDVQSRGIWSQVIVGGCCKTSHTHLSKLRERLQNNAGQETNNS